MVEEEKVVKRRKRAYNKTRGKELDELRELLKNYSMRHFLWRVLEQCEMFWEAPHDDSLMSVMRFEGHRDIGLWLLEEINSAPGEWFSKMQGEAVYRKKVDKPKQEEIEGEDDE